MSNRHPRRRGIAAFPMKSRDVICCQCGKGTNRKQTKAIDRVNGPGGASRRACRIPCQK